jgi:AcrR family transcriptional regulator
MPDGARQSQTEHKESTRRGLLAVAADVFADLGFGATSPADIAAAAHIGRTTFYEYFEDTEDLLAALVEERLPQVFDEIIGAIPRELGIREQLSELVVRMVEFAATDHVLGLQLHQGLPALSGTTQRRIAAAHASLADEFARIFREGVEADELRPMPGDLAGGFVQDLTMTSAKTLMRMEDPKARLHEVADELVTFLLHGLSTRP